MTKKSENEKPYTSFIVDNYISSSKNLADAFSFIATASDACIVLHRKKKNEEILGSGDWIFSRMCQRIQQIPEIVANIRVDRLNV